MTVLAVGAEAPDFTLRDSNNEMVTLSDFRGKKAVLLVFYPFAFTGICTSELNVLQAELDTFSNDDVETFTVSVDSSYSNKVFSDREKFEFGMLSDFWPHGAVATEYGVFNDQVGVANRGTVLIDKDGIVRFSEMNEIGYGRDPQAWRDAVAALLVS